MFTLEKEIKAWLKQFRRHRAFNHGSIREMELHLRDHIEDLLAEGHTEKEAFDLAVKQFGEIPEVAHEEFQNAKRSKILPLLIHHSLLGNYLKIALRNFTKQPFFTFLNTFGLAIGMAGGILIGLFIYDELSFDSMFADADRIHRINIDNRSGGENSWYAAAPGPMAGVLKEDCSQVELVTRFRKVNGALIRKPEATINIKETHITAVDTSFFKMFGLHLLEGNQRTALREPNSIILTQAAVHRFFGKEKALGQSLLIDDTKLFIVTGVLQDMPRNSFLRNHDVFLSLASYEDEKTMAWNTWYFPTFVKLYPGAKVDDLQIFLSHVKENYLIPWAMTFVPGLTLESMKAKEAETGNYMRFNSTALTDIHLYSIDREGEFSPNSNIENVYIMTLIGFFLILLACVNFMNLSTAHSLTRAKEVGIRKTLGSSQFGLVKQFLTESGLISLFSLILSVGVVTLAMPFFNQLADKEISIPFSNPVFWMVLLAATLILGLLSGGYPAFFMSKFIPAKVLKGSLNHAGGSGVRNVLVIFQFVISVFLIVSTLVVYQQVNYIRHKDLGFQKDQILILDDIRAAGNQVESLREEIKRLSQVENVSLSNYLPTPSARGGTTYFLEGAIGKDEFKSENAIIIEEWMIDDAYVPTLNLEIIAGRNLDKKFGSDSNALLLNESAVKMLNVKPEDAIELRMTSDFHRADKENMEYMTVVGVVKNFHFETLRNGIDALSMALGSNANTMIIKLNAGDFEHAISSIQDKWNSVAQGQPFNYYFMDDSFNDTYKAELKLGMIFGTFTMLSLTIACLGLFGLATFSAEKRSKEIGIRKVLGASVKHLTYTISIDFLKLVSVAILVALPLSWYVMTRWLEEFSYRIEVGGWTLALAALIALAISAVTVSYQSIKAAVVNPVKSLRSE